jgi:transcriptional regulator with XRE-family HTH domain
MRLGELIKSVCSRASSMNQAAKKSGVSQGTLSEWQSEKVSPGLERYIDLCLAMGCRPGFELDQYLGLGGAKPSTAEDLLGMALGLDPIQQQRLISLLAGKYSEYLEVQQMIDVNCLIDLIRDSGLSPEKFCKKSGIAESQYTALMHGVLPASVDDMEVLLTLIAATLKNPTTKDEFSSREELIDYCESKKSLGNQQLEPNGTNHR